MTSPRWAETGVDPHPYSLLLWAEGLAFDNVQILFLLVPAVFFCWYLVYLFVQIYIG